MPKVVTIEQMAALEASACAAGVSHAEMMELAGHAVCDTILAHLGDISERKILILAGPGSNGGDGLVAARFLAEAGAEVKIYCLRPRDENDTNLKKALDVDVFVADASNDQRWRVLTNLLRQADVLVDAILGTGARTPLTGTAADLLKRVSRHLTKSKMSLKVAVDCPSGYDCDTGMMDTNMIPADVTVTFGAAKVGQFVFPGADALGDLVLADIGWPDDMDILGDLWLDMASADEVASLLPNRPRNSHKGTFGTALIVAGSVNYAGAPYLAAAAAYRSGAGLVTVGIPAPIYSALPMQLPEATWLLLPSDLGVIAKQGIKVVTESLSRATAMLLGPGWGTEKTTGEFLQGLLLGSASSDREQIGFSNSEPKAGEPGDGKHAVLPNLVLDADGLKLLSKIEGWQGLLPSPSVLTPHPGEMAMMTGLQKEEIQYDRTTIARKFAADWGHVLVLKGAFTIVASPDGRTTINPFATSALARAGTGDVLAGLITGFIAQGMDPYEAAVSGSYVHGMAGELAADVMGTEQGVLAGDVLNLIPKALAATARY